MMAEGDNRPTIPAAEMGSALVMVIFIMVVLALLLAALAYITAQSNQNTAYQIASTRAYWAAQSGAEWGTYQIAPATGSAASQCFSPNPAHPGIGTIPGLGGCSASVQCTFAPASATTSSAFRISSAGTCAAGNLGAAYGATSAIRSVVVGIKTSGGGNVNPTACGNCILQNCGFLDYVFYVLFGTLGPCAQNSCASQCIGGGNATATLNYWLENP
ncbi:hypothetical protein HF285_08155 [Acidithiobacillus ferrooxidans F221]|uniref:hypothetical protein n=1 Tax=Acidithiobacillus ferrooxidans TaxID=920 RepID=UPI001C067BDC|nr:hypothetical protein [Acidithiobacillus ferrooxidans]MBU2808231.1 hypothetical protein [Acidithiobacillus ferrooxidans F221]